MNVKLSVDLCLQPAHIPLPLTFSNNLVQVAALVKHSPQHRQKYRQPPLPPILLVTDAPSRWLGTHPHTKQVT